MILITECYSPRNLGDGELVNATIACVRESWPDEDIKLVALDVNAFSAAAPQVSVIGRIFDRNAYTRTSILEKMQLITGWVTFVLACSLITIITPARFRRQANVLIVKSLCPTSMRQPALAYLQSETLVPVGGGYLGQRYFRESCLTLWTWWWSTNTGARVITMPISIDACGGVLRLLLRVSMRRVVLTVRDDASSAIVTRLRIKHRHSPDLAFRNLQDPYRPAEAGDAALERHRPLRVLIVPVGGDYYPEAIWQDKLDCVLSAVKDSAVGAEIQAFSMHLPLVESRAGYDQQAVDYLTLDQQVSELKGIVDYHNLVSYVNESIDLVITSRMHAGIAALCGCTPLVVLGYEQKHESLMKRLSLTPMYLDFAACTHSRVVAAIKAAMDMSALGVHATSVGETTALKKWRDTL